MVLFGRSSRHLDREEGEAIPPATATAPAVICNSRIRRAPVAKMIRAATVAVTTIWRPIGAFVAASKVWVISKNGTSAIVGPVPTSSNRRSFATRRASMAVKSMQYPPQPRQALFRRSILHHFQCAHCSIKELWVCSIRGTSRHRPAFHAAIRRSRQSGGSRPVSVGLATLHRLALGHRSACRAIPARYC